MQHMVWYTVALVVTTGSLAWAQVAGGGVTAPVNIVTSDKSTATAALANTNKPDFSSRNDMHLEFSAINKELRAQEAKLMAEDTDLRALAEKKFAAQQAITELDKQRRTLLEAKLTADPKFAPLLARHRELMQSVQAMSPTSLGPRGSSLMKPPKEHTVPKVHQVPAAVPASAPATVPAAEHPDGKLKTE